MKVICKLIYATLLTALISSQIAAQNNPGRREKLHNARSLYERAMYPAAMKIVNDIISESERNQITQTELSDAEAIGVLCAIKLNFPNIDGLVDEYIDKYPHSSEKESIRLNQAAYFFNLQDYIRAGEIMD